MAPASADAATATAPAPSLAPPRDRGSAPPAPDLARAAWGAVCLLTPGPVHRVLGGREPDPWERRVLRVLGARHLVQAVASRFLPRGLAAGGGAAVDGLHALTALVLAGVDARRRRSALADVLVAAAWCAWGASRLPRRGA